MSGGAGPGCEGCGGPCAIFGREGSEGCGVKQGRGADGAMGREGHLCSGRDASSSSQHCELVSWILDIVIIFCTTREKDREREGEGERKREKEGRSKRAGGGGGGKGGGGGATEGERGGAGEPGPNETHLTTRGQSVS